MRVELGDVREQARPRFARDVREHAGGRDHERRAARRPRRERFEHPSVRGVAPHEQRRVGGRDVQRRLDASRASQLPRPHEARQESPVAGIRSVQRGEVDPGLDPDQTSAVLLAVLDAAPMLPLMTAGLDFESCRTLITTMVGRFLRPQ